MQIETRERDKLKRIVLLGVVTFRAGCDYLQVCVNSKLEGTQFELHWWTCSIVSSRVWTSPFSEGPSFLSTPSFWRKFKKLPPSFWKPSRLVHANCKKHFKMKVLQCSKFALAVGKCQGFCRGISPFYSICLGNQNAEAVIFLDFFFLSFPRTKKEIFCKRKKDFFHKKTFLQDTNYSCASIFIIHTFISCIFNSLL